MLPKDFKIDLEVPNTTISEFENYIEDDLLTGKEYRFVLEASIVNEEINKKVIKKIELLLPKFLQMIDNKNKDRELFSAQVKSMILYMSSPELPQFDMVANQFPYSKRSIQRKLAKEGFTYRKIIDDIKNELSNYLSKGHKIKTQDIAFLLGYSESCAYLHAVKKWKKGSV
jgi:AraC-like DNA-binding protein